MAHCVDVDVDVELNNTVNKVLFLSFPLHSLSRTTYDFIDNVTITKKTTFNQIGLILTEVEKATRIYCTQGHKMTLHNEQCGIKSSRTFLVFG